MATRLSKKQEQDIVTRAKACIGEGLDHCEKIHRRWEEANRYTRGEQWSQGDLERQRRRDKPAVPWNDVFKVTHAISNREMVARLVPKVFGRNKADEGVANILDEMCRWQRDSAGSEHYESMAFRSATMCGYGVAHKFWDPVAQNGDGMIRDEDVPLCEMLWPARARPADRRCRSRRPTPALPTRRTAAAVRAGRGRRPQQSATSLKRGPPPAADRRRCAPAGSEVRRIRRS